MRRLPTALSTIVPKKSRQRAPITIAAPTIAAMAARMTTVPSRPSSGATTMQARIRPIRRSPVTGGSAGGGGGAGGSIWLDVGTLSGAGHIRADGAVYRFRGGGGGGGRGRHWCGRDRWQGRLDLRLHWRAEGQVQDRQEPDGGDGRHRHVLETPVGAMQGLYRMEADNGVNFDAPIAPFTLAVPGVLH